MFSCGLFGWLILWKGMTWKRKWSWRNFHGFCHNLFSHTLWQLKTASLVITGSNLSHGDFTFTNQFALVIQALLIQSGNNHPVKIEFVNVWEFVWIQKRCWASHKLDLDSVSKSSLSVMLKSKYVSLFSDCDDSITSQTDQSKGKGLSKRWVHHSICDWMVETGTVCSFWVTIFFNFTSINRH